MSFVHQDSVTSIISGERRRIISRKRCNLFTIDLALRRRRLRVICLCSGEDGGIKRELVV
jgi:hypothetical protein